MRIDDVTRPAPMAGQTSFDRIAGSIEGMFDFDGHPNLSPLVLDGTTGQVIRDRDRF